MKKKGKQIFATVKARFMSEKLEIQNSYLHSNEILNIKNVLLHIPRSTNHIN
jgi:hypothetical protein